MTESETIQSVYKKRAKNYDYTTLLYNLVGFRINKYREDMVDALNLKQGDTVIELGCGTGLNFPLILDYF